MKLLAACALITLLSFSTVQAQEDPKTLGEVIDKGGKKLSLDELKAVVPGSKHSSWTPTFNQRTWSHDADGKLTANASVKTTAGRSGGKLLDIAAAGSWKVMDPGLYCYDITWHPQNPASAEKRCFITYKLGDEYFGVASDVDRSTTQMLKFTLTR